MSGAAEAAPSGVESALRLYHSIARLSTASRITWEARVLQLLASRGIGIESRPIRWIGRRRPVEVWTPARQCLRKRMVMHRESVGDTVPSRADQAGFSSNQTSSALWRAPMVSRTNYSCAAAIIYAKGPQRWHDQADRAQKPCCCATAAGDPESISISLHQCSGAPKLWELNPELADAKATATVSAAVHVSANCAAAPMQPERDP